MCDQEIVTVSREQTGGSRGSGVGEAQKGGNICALMADSCCGMAEINTL